MSDQRSIDDVVWAYACAWAAHPVGTRMPTSVPKHANFIGSSTDAVVGFLTNSVMT